MSTSQQYCESRVEMEGLPLRVGDPSLPSLVSESVARMPLPHAASPAQVIGALPVEWIALLLFTLLLLVWARLRQRATGTLHGVVVAALVGSIGLSAWLGTLTLAGMYGAKAAMDGDFHTARSVLSSLQNDWFARPVRNGAIAPWRDATLLPALQTHVVAGAIRQALHDRPAELRDLADVPTLPSVEGATLRAYALIEIARQALNDGDVEHAWRRAERALAAAPKSPHVLEAHRVMQLWLANDMADRGDLQGLRKLVLGWTPEDRAMRTDLRLRILANAAKARFYRLGKATDEEMIDPVKAIADIEQILDLQRRHGDQEAHATHCLLATISIAQASGFSENGQAERALQEVDRALEHVPDAPDALNFLPDAIGAVANERLEQKDGIGALALLNRLQQVRPDAVGIHPARVRALAYSSGQHSAQGNHAAALESAKQAYAMESSPVTAQVLGWAHQFSGDAHRRRAEWDAAQTDYGEAAAYAQIADSEELYKRAKLQEQDAYEFVGRRMYIASLPSWFPLPAIRGQLCVDANEQGTCSRVELYDGVHDEPIAVLSDEADGRTIKFLHRQAQGEVHTIRSFRPDDDTPNLWEIAVNDMQLVWVDTDSDQRPDVRFEYRHGELASQEALSGTVLIRVASAVVATENLDVFSGPDTYFTIVQDGKFLGSSKAVRNTRYPAWGDQFSIQFVYGTNISVGLYDEDVLSQDDFIGAVRLSDKTLPKSAVYRTEAGDAAIDLVAHPTELPPGRYTVESNGNVFKDSTWEIPEISLLIEKASAREDAEFWTREISNLGAAELGAAVLLPRAKIIENVAAVVMFSWAMDGAL